MLSVRKRRPRPKPRSSQILSGAKSVSILAPTKEEILIDRRHEQQVEDSDHRIPLATAHFHETGRTKEIQSTKIFHDACSERVSKSSPEQSVAEKMEERSHLMKQGHIATESPSQNTREATEEDQHRSNVAQNMLTERFSSEENTNTDASGMQKLRANQSRASPFPGKLKRNEELSNQWGAFSLVPPGIVSSRLRGIAASDPGLDPPSGVAGILKADRKGAFTPKRRLNTTASSSHTFENFPTDPLSRVSGEEDIASLASLAEVIQSQNRTVHIDIGSSMDLIKPPDTPVNVAKSRTRSTFPVTSMAELHSIESSSKKAIEEEVQESQTLAMKRASSVGTGILPLTPRRSATESSVLQRSGGSSVKALAARYGNTESNARQTPSPIHTPGSRVWHGSLGEKAAVAPYTVNTSPVPLAQKLARSDASLHTIGNPVQVKTSSVVSLSRLQNAASPLLPKPLFPNSYLQEDSGPPRWPKLRPVNRSPRIDSKTIQVGRNSVTLSPFSSCLHRTGDGNVSFALSRKSSLGTILPRPDEPPIAGHTDFARPTTMYADHCSLISEFSTSSPFVNIGLSSSSVGGQRTKNQSTSILYTQIQHLSRQLKAKTDEADHLRQQLMTKDSLNDLGTLSQQLRQVKRELAVWRGRAELAEKRLEMFSQLPQRGVNETVAGEQSATDSSKTGGESFIEEGGRFQAQVRNEPHGLDAICRDHDILGSEGTVRSANTKQRHASETELDSV